MKIFISYKFANEDHAKLEEFMKNIKAALEKSNHQMLTTFFYEKEFKENNASMRKIMDKALNLIESSDLILCIVYSSDKSEGQIFEMGYSVAKNKKFILAVQKDLPTRWLPHYADKIIKFSDLNDLYKQLEKV
jgi:nucleoside 2-deoxyribosyltransferase